MDMGWEIKKLKFLLASYMVSGGREKKLSQLAEFWSLNNWKRKYGKSDPR